MEKLENMQSLVTSDSITLFWDKPAKAEPTELYQVYMDGARVGKTDKTHYTLEKLQPEKEYQLAVLLCTAHDETVASSDSMSIRTIREKEKIDISKAPYFAKGDGHTVNTAAIQKAFDDCRENQMVYIPAGTFMTGALRMHSDMELYLEEAACLHGTDQVADYLPRIPSRFEGKEMECYSSLLNLGELDHTSGYNCRNVIIRGKGTIAGGGVKLAKQTIVSEREKLKEYIESLGSKINTYENMDTIPGRVRSRLINLSNCQDIRISGVTLRDGASWNVHMIYADHIVTDHCFIYSKGIWNGDGWDPDSSTNCTIFASEFFTEDDSIAIKSGKNPEGNQINRPTEHIRIFDCKSAFGHGIAIGSEMSGGINDIQIWDCDFRNCAYGIEIKGTKKRGGFVRNVFARDCIVPRIMFHSVGYNDDGAGAAHPPVFEKCLFEGLTITGRFLSPESIWESCDAIELRGFEEEAYHLKDIEFRDIKLKGDGKHKISMQYCKNISFINVG